MIKELFSFITKPLTQWLKNRGEIAKAKHKRNLAVINNQARLASDEQSFNHEWEMASLQDKDKALRYISFLLFSLPIIITVLLPEYGKTIFANLENVPDWWVKTFIAINGGIWGIVELKNAAPQLINAIKGAVKK
jgi:hypothetical protein